MGKRRTEGEFLELTQRKFIEAQLGLMDKFTQILTLQVFVATSYF